MTKKLIIRGVLSFIYAAFAGMLIELLILLCTNRPDFAPLVPSFAARFASPYVGMIVQCLFTGLIGLSFGLGSFIFEKATWGFLAQCLVHLGATAVVWIPVSVFCWGLGTHFATFLSTIISFLFTYVVTWLIQYLLLRKNIAQINARLKNHTEE